MKSSRCMPANPLVTQGEIDLLVMNELSAVEMADLVNRLDREADGWRRCALAFIESQQLGVKLRVLLEGPVACVNALNQTAAEFEAARARSTSSQTTGGTGGTEVVRRTPIRPRAISSLRRVQGFWIAAAATWMLAAFCAGRFFVPAPGGQPGAGAAPGTFDEPWPAGMEIVENGRFSGRIANTQAIRQLSWSFNSASEPDVEVVALVDIGSDTADRFVPVVASQRLEREIELLPQPQVAPEMDRSLKQAGWKLETRRQLLSLMLPDGSRSLLPIDRVNCRFVGRNTY